MTTPAAPSILDTIDNAIADYELSADAMRWTTERPALAAGGHVAATPDVAAFVESCGLVLTEWQRQVANRLCTEQITVRFDAAAWQMRRIVAEAMKGLGDAIRPLLAELRKGEPCRPERVARMRRAYRAKRGGRW